MPGTEPGSELLRYYASNRRSWDLKYCPMHSLYLAHKAGSYIQESLLELKWLLLVT
jgi:hypothetical protein